MNRRHVLKTSALATLGLNLSPALLLSLESCARERPTSKLPVYLDPEQFDLVWVASDIILPRTATPGAIDSGVTPFIDKLYGSFMEDSEKEFFLEGLTEFAVSCKEKYGRDFLHLDPNSQMEYLKGLDEKGSDHEFFNKLKQIVLWSHFTSEPGMKSMNYVPVPTKFDGCISIGKEEKNIVGNR